jgi:hypothetical protein
MKGKQSSNAAKNFAVTFYLQKYPKELKEEKGIEPKASDFVDAFHELTMAADELKIKSMICQVERGSNGTIHLQGYLQMQKKIRISTLSKRIRANTKFHGNLLVANGSARENIDYCSKPTGDWTYSNGMVKHSEQLSKPMWINEDGFNMVKGQRNDLKAAIKAIDAGADLNEIAELYPTTWVRSHRGISDYYFRKQMKDKSTRAGLLYIFWGKAGTGKSWTVRNTFCRELGYTPDDIYSLQTNKRSPWFDGYNGEKVLLIDDYEKDDIPIGDMKKLTDIYQIHPQIKGGHTVAKWEVVIITSNHPPMELFTEWEYDDYRQVMAEIPNRAMMSRIDDTFCFNNMPNLRAKGEGYNSTMVCPQSVATLLPATLAHGTNSTKENGDIVTMQGSRDAIPTHETSETTLAQFLENGTDLEEAHDQIFTTEKEETA